MQIALQTSSSERTSAKLPLADNGRRHVFFGISESQATNRSLADAV